MYSTPFHRLTRLTARMVARWRQPSDAGSPLEYGNTDRGHNTGTSAFKGWVDELDQEIIEYITGHKFAHLLLQSEQRSAAVKARQTARRQQEVFLGRRPLHN